ncbi:MAG: hypothetical protein R3249_07230 [Nitriliruptorales bacterium]|nr:hypothetical protein [Nitriliruptorales bacterium]
MRDEPVRRRFPWVALLVGLFVGSVFAALTLSALAAEDAVTARQLQLEVTEAERDYAQLVAEVATLESPERIARMAEEMGMVRTAVPRTLPVDRPLDVDGLGEQEPLLAEGDGIKPLLTEQR